jgi:hypothetical protein
MPKTHGVNPIILFLNSADGRRIETSRGPMESPRERVISISLNEQEWQQFVRLHPQPVNWLRERIQESIVVDGATAAPLSAAAAANTTSATTR